jgi:hypothetical protein
MSSRIQTVGLVVSAEDFRAGYSKNVIAELPGYGDASKVVIIGAHYDSRSTSLSVPLPPPTPSSSPPPLPKPHLRSFRYRF